MKLVFMGDSITDAFHKLNVDEAGLGNGYVALIAERLKEMGRADFVRNSGHDGFTVSGLLRLFEYDCLQFHPDLVTVQIGSNDAAVYMNTGKTLEEQGFGDSYRKLLGRIREETGAKILCLGPFIFPSSAGVRQLDPGDPEDRGAGAADRGGRRGGVPAPP